MGHDVSFWPYLQSPELRAEGGNAAVTQAEIHNFTPGTKIRRNASQGINQIHILLSPRITLPLNLQLEALW